MKGRRVLCACMRMGVLHAATGVETGGHRGLSACGAAAGGTGVRERSKPQQPGKGPRVGGAQGQGQLERLCCVPIFGRSGQTSCEWETRP